MPITLNALNQTPAHVPDDAATTEPFEQRWHIWHANRLDALESPHGYLSPVSITWLGAGDEKRAEHFPGSWIAEDDAITYVPETSRPVTNAGREVKIPLTFRSRFHGEEDLAVFDFGAIRAEVKSQPDALNADAKRFWIRVKNPDSPLRRAFNGDVPHFPLSRDWVLPAHFEPFESTELSTQDTVAEQVLQVLPTIGRVVFDYQGNSHSLEVVDVHGTPTVFFADETSGKQTYGTGRILELGRANARGIKRIDFNRAYNFPCAFTPYCTCPIPKTANRLPFAVTAGELTPQQTAYTD